MNLPSGSTYVGQSAGIGGGEGDAVSSAVFVGADVIVLWLMAKARRSKAA